MGQLRLEGATLGERCQHYNRLLKEAIAEKPPTHLESINIEDNDIDNFFKIDIASSNRNVEYIIEVLKSDDMTFVSRAIQRSTWLITDPQYSHIVNPEYLHTQLFPQTTVTASNMILSQIRRHLKDEARIDGFYSYFKDKKKERTALKWLPYCSFAIIKREVENQGIRDYETIKRLCQRSFTFFEKNISKTEFDSYCLVQNTRFLKTHTEQYLNIVDTLENYGKPKFGAKATNTIMKICPHRIMDNFEKYYQNINLKIFAKHLKNADVKDFLLKYYKKKSMTRFFQPDNLSHFLRHIPIEDRFEFVQKLFIEKDNTDESDDTNSIASSCTSNSEFKVPLYYWYRFAPFTVAFPALIQLIRNKSFPLQLNRILYVLVSCAGRNLCDVHTLLQYYHDEHSNESFDFNIQFLDAVLSKSDVHLYDERIWNILNSIFFSKEYTESKRNKVQLCVQYNIVYRILHNKAVPDVIEKKFEFNSLKSLQNKLNKEEQEKVFNHLYDMLVSKIEGNKIKNESQFAELVKSVDNILTLILDWKKDLSDYPWIVTKIKEIIGIKKDKSYTTELSSLYNKKKSWRKHLLEESLVLNPSEVVCINALKHDPDLLTRYRSEEEALFLDDQISLKQLLRKLRIYWPDTMASEWATWCLKKLNSPEGHKALIRGLYVLLPQKQLLSFVEKYAPTKPKVNWNKNKHLFSIRSNIAGNMARARSPPSLETMMLYAQGDYLQYALPSLKAVLYNMRRTDSRPIVEKLLKGPMALQKCGIEVAVAKLENEEIKQIYTDIWRSNKNATIRAALFQQTYNLLCKKSNAAMIKDIWEMLKMFIENLSPEKDGKIYKILGEVDKVPRDIRPEFSRKAYELLKSLSAKTHYRNILKRFVNNMSNVMEDLDDDLVAGILLESIEKFATKKSREKFTNNLASYLLCAKNAEIQIQRYERVLAPLLDRIHDSWNVKVKGHYNYWNNLLDLLRDLRKLFPEYTFGKGMVLPVKMFQEILNKLEENLSLQSNYVRLRSWRLTVSYIKHLEEHGAEKGESINYDSKMWQNIGLGAAPGFAAHCVEFLKNETITYSTRIYMLFAEALNVMFVDMDMDRLAQLKILKSILECKDFPECYLMVIYFLNDYFYYEEDAESLNEIKSILLAHPSEEIKMYYYLSFRPCFDSDSNPNSYSSSEVDTDTDTE